MVNGGGYLCLILEVFETDVRLPMTVKFNEGVGNFEEEEVGCAARTRRMARVEGRVETDISNMRLERDTHPGSGDATGRRSAERREKQSCWEGVQRVEMEPM